MAARGGWLGRWWFLAAVVLLALNDHLLKARYPGWWTGKLSDVAGVAVVGTLAAAVLGRRPGLALAGVAFVALKVVPGAAELVAPVLGGVTRRDSTDLLALVALVPLWWVLRESELAPPSHAARPTRPASRTDWRRVAASIVPILGATTAVFVATADICGPTPAVVKVLADGPTVFAAVDQGSIRWAASSDGGETWRRTSRPVGVAEPQTSLFDDSPMGPSRSCTGSVCLRIVGRRSIQRSVDGSSGPWRTERVVTDAEFERVDTGCAGPQTGVLTSVASPSASGGGIVSYGAVGVLARSPDGSWHQQPVLGADQGVPGPAVLTLPTLLLSLVTVVGIAAAWFLGRPKSLDRRVGMAVLPVCTIGMLMVTPMLTVPGSHRRPNLAMVAVWVVVAVVGVLVARSHLVTNQLRPTRPTAHLPPPPDPWAQLPPPPPLPPPSASPTNSHQ